MSNTILTHTIKAPDLNTTGYATELSGVFDKINENFSTLANRDFIKGDTGESLMIESVPLFDNGTFTEYGNRLIEYIETKYEQDQNIFKDIITEDGTELHWYDNIKNPNAYIHLIYTYHKDSNGEIIKTSEQPISSLYFVFLDGRFANDKLKYIDWENYIDISDLSGVLIVENGAFTMLPNAFPTMYYEAGVGLCWKVNGNKTGLLVQGPKGNDGKNTPLLIVKASLNDPENNDGQLKGVVTEYYTPSGGFTPIELEDYSEYEECTAIILNESKDENKSHDFYFGKLIHIDNDDDNYLYAYCDQNTGINIEIENASFLNLMKSIDIYDKNDYVEPIPGLFVPIKEYDNDTEISAHLISATISDLRATDTDYKKPKKDLIVAPVDDLNNIDILKVERYLYVKVNESNNIITKLSSYYNNLLKDECNYILKYKLTDISYDIETEFIAYNETTEFVSGIYSRYFAEYNSTRLNDNNTVCYKHGSKTTDSSDNTYEQLLNSMPTTFSSRVASGEESKTKKGIYRWELHRELPLFNHENIDINEYTKSTNQHNVMPFKVIYTTDLTPNVYSEIMWFNGISVDKYKNGDHYIYGFGYDIENDPNNDLFKVIKCVSAFNDISIDKNLSSDTALNINYNVNVIGSTNNFKRDLAVSGDITGKNLTVSGDITGKNLTVSDGISAANGNFVVNDNNINVTSDGNVSTTGTISAASEKFLVDATGNIEGTSFSTNSVATKDDGKLKVYNDGKIEISVLTTDGKPHNKLTIDPTDTTNTNTNSESNFITISSSSAVRTATNALCVKRTNKDGVINDLFKITSNNGEISAASGKFNVDANGNIAKLAGVSDPKIQYKPRITDFNYSKDNESITISDYTIDPGNHSIYRIYPILKITEEIIGINGIEWNQIYYNIIPDNCYKWCKYRDLINSNTYNNCFFTYTYNGSKLQNVINKTQTIICTSGVNVQSTQLINSEIKSLITKKTGTIRIYLDFMIICDNDDEYYGPDNNGNLIKYFSKKGIIINTDQYITSFELTNDDGDDTGGDVGGDVGGGTPVIPPGGGTGD